MLVEQREDVAVLRIQIDHLDSSNCAAFKSDVEQAAGSARRVVLDMRSLRFVDSAGLGAILSTLRRLGESGGVLKIAGTTRAVEQLFGLVRLQRIIDMHPTVDEAVRAFHA